MFKFCTILAASVALASAQTMPPWVAAMLNGNGNQASSGSGGMPDWVANMMNGQQPRPAAPVAGDDIPLQKNFDTNRYLGKWYEIFRHKQTPFESGTDNTATYSLYENGSVKVVNREWLPGQQVWNVAYGVATPVSNARLGVKFGMGPPGDYRVLYTDYTGCAVVYSKTTFRGRSMEYGWVLARQPQLDADMEQMAFDLYQRYTGLTRGDFNRTVHGVAPAGVQRSTSIAPRGDGPPQGMGGSEGGMPDWVREMLANGGDSSAQPSGEVELQANFDKDRYLGKWYEIYRHKNVAFQSGTDGTATYSLFQNGSVKVVNREWLPDDEQWTVANGIAKPISGAKFTVQFSPNAPPGDYRVLYTDYDNIALVYSNTNYGGFQMVYGWVLARTPTISAQTDQMAFGIFKTRTGLEKSEFLKTQHGVAGTDATTTPKNLPALRNREKCGYKVPTLTCQKSIGRQIVYDLTSGRCGIQSTGCSREAVERYAFRSAQECFNTCIYNIPTFN